MFDVDSREWIARFQAADDIAQGKKKAEELTKAYLESAIHSELPSVAPVRRPEPVLRRVPSRLLEMNHDAIGKAESAIYDRLTEFVNDSERQAESLALRDALSMIRVLKTRLAGAG